jgi:hypothetical protein
MCNHWLLDNSRTSNHRLRIDQSDLIPSRIAERIPPTYPLIDRLGQRTHPAYILRARVPAPRGLAVGRDGCAPVLRYTSRGRGGRAASRAHRGGLRRGARLLPRTLGLEQLADWSSKDGRVVLSRRDEQRSSCSTRAKPLRSTPSRPADAYLGPFGSRSTWPTARKPRSASSRPAPSRSRRRSRPVGRSQRTRSGSGRNADDAVHRASRPQLGRRLVGVRPQVCGFPDHHADLAARVRMSWDYRRRTRTTSAKRSIACTSRSCETSPPSGQLPPNKLEPHTEQNAWRSRSRVERRGSAFRPVRAGAAA